MKELHLICNAHLDPVWQWDWNEGATAALTFGKYEVKTLLYKGGRLQAQDFMLFL